MTTGITTSSFNIFGNSTQKEISVGYISSHRGYVQNVSLCEANDYEKENPGTAYIFKTRDAVEYLDIEQVNLLTPESSIPQEGTDGCKIDMNHECSEDPQVHFYGGGGVGVFANPVVGDNNGLIALDITNPGYGYQYPPKVEVKDECGYISGAVVRVQVSDGDNCVESWKYYTDEQDLLEPDVCADNNVEYGRVWSVDGEDLGEWDPVKYTKYAEDPRLREVDAYLESLKNLENPWWTTRNNLTKQHITWSSNGEVSTVGYAVSVPAWSDFLNLYGVSPVPPSDKPGTAYGGETFDFEWDIDFPWGGEYIFRGLYDGEVGFGDLYVDNQKISSLNRWDGLTDPIKYNVGIATTKKVSFKLHNGAFTKKAAIQPVKEIDVTTAGGKFIKEGNNYFYKVSGNDLVDIDFDFAWDKSIDAAAPKKPAVPARVQVKLLVYTSGGGDGLKFRFTSQDGSHSFEIKSDDYTHNAAAKELNVNVIPNTNYNVVSSKTRGLTEQGLLKSHRFGRSGKEQDSGTSDAIFADKCGSRDDDDDLQVKAQSGSGMFTAGAGIPTGSGHDSWAITYRVGSAEPVDNTPKERPAITKLTIQTETEPLVFQIPKTDRQPANTGGQQTPWVHVGGWPGVFPTDKETLGDEWQTGEWTINVTTPGNYTLKAWSDDRLKIFWDGNQAIGYGKRGETVINNISAGIHKLKGQVLNKAKYGRTFGSNPGALFWTLKDATGNVVANSRDPFNDASLANNLGRGGKDWQQKGIISKKGNFKNGRKYRVTFDRQPYTKVPVIGDTGASPNEDDQKIDFFDKGHRKGNTLQIITPKNVVFAARNAYQLSEGTSRVVYPANVRTSRQTIFNTLKYIDKANIPLWKSIKTSGLLGKYGIAPFDTALHLPDMPYAGEHKIIWANITFPVSTNYEIMVHVDDDVRITIGDQVDFFQDGFILQSNKKNKATGTVTHKHFIKEGTYTITAWHTQIPGGRWPNDNPMALAIDIQAEVAYKTVADPKSWNENPMGIALSIEAPPPAPPPGVMAPVLEEGECPESPIWHTQMQADTGIGSRWYPVKFGYWDKWVNKYAVSPIPPLNTPGSDGTGNTSPWKNTWKVTAPYEGDYILKGCVDNFGWIEVDGVEVSSRRDDPNVDFKDEEYKRSSLDVVVKPKDVSTNKWPQETKVFLSEGDHYITVNVANYKNYETKVKYLTQKIFSTKDWQSAAPVKNNVVNKPHGLIFTRESNRYYLTAYGNDKVDADLAFIWDALEGGSPPPPPAREQVTFLVYTSGGGDGLKFKFTAADGSHSFDIKSDDYTHDAAAVELKVNLKPNTDYNILSSKTSGQTEQGLLKSERFGRSGKEQDSGTSNSIFADKCGSRDDDDDLQIQCKTGLFTAGAGIPTGSGHDSWAITYRFTGSNQSTPNYIPPSVVKVTVQTETEPLVFNVPKTDAQSGNVTGPQTPWVHVGGWPGVFPTDQETLGDQWQTGEWTINIPQDGDYTIKAWSDDRLKIFWDGNQAIRYGKRGETVIRAVSKGIHKLKGQVLNKAKYGNTFDSNPGALFWTLKDTNNSLVANSRDPFAGSNPADHLGKGGDQWQIKGNIQKRGNFKAGKKYEINFVGGYGKNKDGGAILTSPTPTILESGWVTDKKDAIKSNPKMAFKNPWDYLQAVSVYQLSSAIGTQDLIIDTTRNGVTYNGPSLYNYRHKSYGSWMNSDGVAPDYPKVGGEETINYVWSNVNFPVTGEYEFRFANDSHGSLYLDGDVVIDGDFDAVAGISDQDRRNWNPGLTRKMNVNKGKHKITVAPTPGWGSSGLFKKKNAEYLRGSAEWEKDASAMAIGITRLVEDKPEPGTPAAQAQSGKSWYQNPVGISARLIPPPCKQIKCGKGRVINPIVIDPGTGFPDPPPPPDDPDREKDPKDPPPGYPVLLVPTGEVVITNPGINYNTWSPPDGSGGGDPQLPPDEMVVIDPPNSGIGLTWKVDGFGRINKVGITTYGPGVTRNPTVRLKSPTGVNFSCIIPLKVIRDPIGVPDPSKLIQVTDLVGLKQTGYIEGRAYYGSVYYKEGTRYAGVYETAGRLVQVYDTLQESIDAEVTAPPSAIQRQGTDVSSNDPRLNIPGTPDNLT